MACLRHSMCHRKRDKRKRVWKTGTASPQHLILACPSWELTRAQVGHGGGQLEVGRVVGGDTNLDGASPLVHHLVDAHLEHLSVPQGSAAQHHAVIEVVGGTEGMASGDSDPPPTVLQSSALQRPGDTHCPSQAPTVHTPGGPPTRLPLPPTCPPSPNPVIAPPQASPHPMGHTGASGQCVPRG